MDKGRINMHNKQFSDLAIGNVFRMNGNIYVKQSTRTAWLVEYSRWFYFGKREIVELLLDNRFTFQTIGKHPFDVHSAYFCGEFIASEQSQLDAINKAIAYNVERMKAYK